MAAENDSHLTSLLDEGGNAVFLPEGKAFARSVAEKSSQGGDERQVEVANTFLHEEAQRENWKYFNPEQDSFPDVLKRFYDVTESKTQMDLASVLCVRQSSISDAKKRNSVPPEWFLKVYDRYGINPDWLKKDFGQKYIALTDNEEDRYLHDRVLRRFSREKIILALLFEEISDATYDDIMRYMYADGIDCVKIISAIMEDVLPPALAAKVAEELSLK